MYASYAFTLLIEACPLNAYWIFHHGMECVEGEQK